MSPSPHPSVEPGDEPSAPPVAPALRRGERWSATAAALVIAGVVGFAGFAGRRLWFFSDEWNIFAEYHDANLLQPFNSHLSLVPAGAFQLLFRTVGVDDYLPYRLVGLVCFAWLGWVVWRYGAARVGPVTAVVAAAAVVWGSGGSTNLLLPFLLNFSVPIGALAAVWWHLDRGARQPELQRRSDLWVGWWLLVGLATSGLGLMVTAAVGFEFLIRRVGWHRWLLVAPGPLLWLIWYARFGVDSPPNDGVVSVASYTVRVLWGGLRALGANHWSGAGVLCVAAAALVVAAWRRPGADRARLVAAWAVPLVFAALTAWSRTGVLPRIPPDELRYRWTVAAFIVLAAVSSLPRESGWWREVPARAAVAVCAALVVAGSIPLVRDSRRWVAGVDDALPGLEAVTFATEAAGAAVDPDRIIPLSFVPVRAGDYLAAVAAVGSPLTSIELDTWSGRPDQRVAADEILADGVTVTSRKCVEGSAPTDTLRAPGGARFVVSSAAGTRVTLHRFVEADQPTPVGVDVADGRVVLQLPSDPASASGRRDYVVRVGGDASLEACGAG